MLNRRDFIQTVALAGAALPLQAAWKPAPREIHCFSKPFQKMDYRQLCNTFAEAGVNGVDYTVRPEGHVLPERVADDLPKAVEAARSAGLQAVTITTALLKADDPFTEPILKTASALGIRYYRMGWYDYPAGRSLQDGIQQCRSQLQALADINRQYKIKAAYQNHSGTKVGAAVWDLYEMIKGLDPAWAGVQYDIRHATVEGANSWPLGLQLIAPYINTLVIKDVKWSYKQGKYELENVPLGEGMVDFKAYAQWLDKLNIHVPVILHLEYPLPGDRQALLQVLKKDVNTLRRRLTS
jgi:L-ribulose-5-phosphate 3-epimerase